MWLCNCNIPAGVWVSLAESPPSPSEPWWLMNGSAALSGSSSFNGNWRRKKKIPSFQCHKNPVQNKGSQKESQRTDLLVGEATCSLIPINNLAPVSAEFLDNFVPKWTNSTNMLWIYTVSQLLCHVLGMHMKDRSWALRSTVYWLLY